VVHIATHLAALALLFGAFFGAGSAVAYAIRPLGLPREWSGLTAVVLGIAAWLTLLFVCAALGHLDRTPLLGLVFAAAVLAIVITWRHRSAHLAGFRRLVRDAPSSGVALIAVAAPVVVLAALCFISLTPLVGWDDSVAHLTLPRIYLAHGGFVRVPFNVYSNWPLNPQLLYALAMLVQDYILAKLVHLAFLGLTVFAVYRLTSTYSSPLGGCVAAALLLANPVVLDEARSAYIDLAFAFFFFMAFVCALEHIEQRRVGPLLLSGICCGIVAGTKLTGAIAAPCIALLVIVARIRRSQWTELHSAVADALLWIALPAVLLALPWYLRAYVYTGNPFYPLFYERFGGPEWSSALNQQFLAWQQSIGMGRQLADYLLLPLRVAVSGGDDYGHFDGRINPLWVILVPFSLTCIRSSAVIARSLGVAGLYFIVWAATSQQARFLIPMLPLLAVAAGVALSTTVERTLALRPVHVVTVSAVVVLSLLWTTRSVIRDGAVAAREMIVGGVEVPGEARNDVERFISEQLPAATRLMLLNTNQGFFIERDYVADSFFEASQLNALVLQGDGGAPGISRRLRKMGITHVLFARRDWGIPYPPALSEFLANQGLAQLIFASPDKEYLLFQVRGATASNGG